MENHGVNVLLNLAILQLESARAAKDDLSVCIARAAMAAGILDTLREAARLEDGLSEPYGLKGYWFRHRLEGADMALTLSSYFPGVPSYQVAIYDDTVSMDDRDLHRVTEFGVTIFLEFRERMFANPSEIELRYSHPLDQGAEGRFLAIWGPEGELFQQTEVNPSVILTGSGSWVVNPGGLLVRLD